MLYKIALRNIHRHFRRSAVTILTVSIGTAGLFLFQAFNEGIKVGSYDLSVHGKYGHGQITTKGYRDKIAEKPWEAWIKNASAVSREIEHISGVIGAYPRIEFFSLLSNGNMNLGGKGIGVDGAKEADFFYLMKMIEGEPLGNNLDGIIMGKGLAAALGVSVGDQITVLGNTIRGSINGLDLQVSGIFEFGLREIDDSLFQIQLTRAQELLDTQSVEYYAIGLKEGTPWQTVSQTIESKFPELQATSFEVLDKIWYKHTIDWLAQQFSMIRLIILTIVILGIFNSTSTAILERTREFGMLRANGESKFDVLRLLIWEGGIMALVGGVIGIVVVVLLSITFLRHGIFMPPPPGYTQVIPVFVQLTVPIGMTSFFYATMTAVIATIIAAQKVTRMSIAAALRST